MRIKITNETMLSNDCIHRGILLLCFLSLLMHFSCTSEQNDKEFLDYLTQNNFLHGKAEIIFLLDRSGSVGATNFEIQKGFVESFLTHIKVDYNASRVAVVSYSSNVVRHIDYLKEPKTKCHLAQEMQEVVFKNSGATNIAGALKEAREILKNARPNVNKVVILISDGLATAGGNPILEAKSLKESGVQIFAFGIGKFLQTELLTLASSGRHFYSCLEFKEFKRLARKIRGDPNENAWSGNADIPKCSHLCDSPYKGDPNDPGCCDHDARCSCALLSGMHTCVCGPGHYGLSGLMGECKACPRGTYKSKWEPKDRCEPCPFGSTTADVASTSLLDCYCKEGYHGDPYKGIPCTIVNCPILQPPTNGHLFGSCQTSYGSTCIFACEDGYQLVDRKSDFRTCQKDGTWTGSTTICTKTRCPRPRPPIYGRLKCDEGELTMGKRCHFACNVGYLMNGSVKRECMADGSWSGKEPKCIAVTCPLPPDIKQGRLLNCHEKPNFGDSCIYTCNEGFRIKGPQWLFCDKSGKLVDNMNQETRPYCEDIIPPKITCPPSIKFTVEKNKNYVFARWDAPEATDNSGYFPKLKVIPENMKPPVLLYIGTSLVKYIAIDNAGLNATCEIKIEVIDNTPPVVIKCPSTIEVSSPDVRTPAEWEEPLFQDNDLHPVTVKKSASSGQIFDEGRHHITYYALDQSGNQAYCVFEVIVTRTNCPYIPAPANGALTCEDWMYGQFCQIYCNSKHDFVEKPAEWYVCNSEARWVTVPEGRRIPWPDCAKPSSPTKIRQMVDAFYYHGDCNDPNVQRQLKKIFLHNFFKKYGNKYCNTEGSCKIEKVKIKCGKISDVPHGKRFRRDLWPSQNGNLEFELEITLNDHHTANETDYIVQDLLNTIRNLEWEDLSQENSDLDFTTITSFIEADVDLNHAEDNFKDLIFADIKTVLICEAGSIPTDDKCVACPPGTYYEISTEKCVHCPIGSYQELQGKLQCQACPLGKSTEFPRTRNQSDCKSICPKGTYSSTGLETCLACPKATYQDALGRQQCIPCPEGKTTSNLMSDSISDCKDACEAGTFSENGLRPCTLCPRSFYQPSPGQTSCLECPPEMTTRMTGSQNHTDCIAYNLCESEVQCKNSGRCIQKSGREAICECRPGFEGDRCENDIVECLSQPCHNKALCVNVEGSFDCICNPGFTGKLCEEEIDECGSSPCKNNGTCLDQMNGYTCICQSSLYEGINCEIKRDVCFDDIICLNGGTCLKLENETYCACAPGFTGSDCSVNLNDCLEVTCYNNGSCIDGIDSYECSCKEGFDGKLCEIEIDECLNNTCFSGSTCIDLIGGYLCLCPPGWSGTFCETKLNSDFIMIFPESKATVGNLASVSLGSPLSEATVSMWIQTTDTERTGTPLSYATAIVSDTAEKSVIDNALTISDCSGIEIYVNNEPIITDTYVADGRWHHLAFTWSSENLGKWAFYKDGELKSQGQGLRHDDVIAKDGILIIGQEQDTLGGGFSPLETFTGNLTRLNIWNNYFTSENITRLCQMDDDIEGKVIAWPDFLSGIKGEVEVIKQEKPSFN